MDTREEINVAIVKIIDGTNGELIKVLGKLLISIYLNLVVKVEFTY